MPLVDRYSLDAALLQQIVRLLESLPAGQTRHMLNAIEAECIAQDAQPAPAPAQAADPPP